MKGYSLLELLVVVALLGLLAFLFAGDFRTHPRSQEFENFARETASLLEKCRWTAMNRRVYAGAILNRGPGGSYTMALYVDGNDNGIRTNDVDTGTDRLFYGPVDLYRAANDMAPAILHDQVPLIPPRRGYIDTPEDPVKFGRSNIISFSPYGDSSSGTLYLACKSLQEMYALVLYGPTARMNLWKYSNFRWQMVEDR